MASLRLAAADLVADLVDVEGNLGNQNHIGRSGDTGAERDESGVPAHHFDDHDSFVAFGGRVQLVDRVRGGRNGGIESERRDRAADVVVDRFRDADDGKALLPEIKRDAQRALATNRDQRVEPIRTK